MLNHEYNIISIFLAVIKLWVNTDVPYGIKFIKKIVFNKQNIVNLNSSKINKLCYFHVSGNYNTWKLMAGYHLISFKTNRKYEDFFST